MAVVAPSENLVRLRGIEPTYLLGLKSEASTGEVRRITQHYASANTPSTMRLEGRRAGREGNANFSEFFEKIRVRHFRAQVTLLWVLAGGKRGCQGVKIADARPGRCRVGGGLT